MDCCNPQQHQWVAEKISKFQVVLEPGRSSLQHGLNEMTLQQGPVPPDEHVIKMVGGIGSEPQARLSIGDQEQQTRKHVSGGSKPGGALTVSAERNQRGEGQCVERHADAEVTRDKMEHEGSEGDVSEESDGNQFGDGKAGSHIENRRNRMCSGQSPAGGVAHGVCSPSSNPAENHGYPPGAIAPGPLRSRPPITSVFLTKPEHTPSL